MAQIKVIRKYVAPPPKKAGTPMTLGVSETERENSPNETGWDNSLNLKKKKGVSAVSELEDYLEKNGMNWGSPAASKSTVPAKLSEDGAEVYEYKSSRWTPKKPLTYQCLVFPDHTMSCNC